MTETWIVKRLLDWSDEYFTKHAIDSAKYTAQLLLAYILQCKRLELFINFERILTQTELDHYKELVRRRLKHEPVEHILGTAEFMGMTFQVSPDVLIPRQETEILAETAIQFLQENVAFIILNH